MLKILGWQLGWEGRTYLLPIIILKRRIPFLDWKLVPSTEVFQRKDMKYSQKPFQYQNKFHRNLGL